MSFVEFTVEYEGHYRFTPSREKAGYVVWVERLDRQPMSVGRSWAHTYGTPPYEVLDHAFAEAKACIDSGAWK